MTEDGNGEGRAVQGDTTTVGSRLDLEGFNYRALPFLLSLCI